MGVFCLDVHPENFTQVTVQSTDCNKGEKWGPVRRCLQPSNQFHGCLWRGIRGVEDDRVTDVTEQ